MKFRNCPSHRVILGNIQLKTYKKYKFDILLGGS